MKKIFLISLSMILGIALVGCGKTNSDNNIVISDEVSSDTVSSNVNMNIRNIKLLSELLGLNLSSKMKYEV